MPRKRLTRLCLLTAVLLLLSTRPLLSAEPSLDRTGTQWAPFLEWSLENPSHTGNPFDLIATATFRHEDEVGGVRTAHTTGLFYAGENTWKFRFTGTKPGKWSFTTKCDDADLDGKQGTVTIRENPGRYGFVTHAGNKWARRTGPDGRPEAFVPQYVMYGHPAVFSGKPEKIDRDIRTFLVDHGFTGFHVPVFCRWFDLHRDRAAEIDDPDPNPDPRTFEALEMLITKVHAAGGVVHLWAWGDQMRTQTPIKWKINGPVDCRLQRYIAARLGPLPGWTMGYGFDLWEWVEGDQLTAWHRHMHAHLGWPHLLGARSARDSLEQISEDLDYASFEQHRPTLETYRRSIDKRPHKPAFSEDRFRIRQSDRYRFKDYTMEMVRRGLWHSAIAGGVANIWGNLQGKLAINMGDGASLPFPEPQQIKTYSKFFENRFFADMRRDDGVSNAASLQRPDNSLILLYREDCDSIRFDLSKLPRALPAVAVDTKKPYREIDLGAFSPDNHRWKAPHTSDWALAIGEGE